MRVSLVTMFYNEEDFAPFFFKHYSWVDEIFLILDSDTNDRTLEIAKLFSNITLIPFTFPDGMDDILKTAKINEVCKMIDSDWIIVVDSDEFIFNLDSGSNLKRDLSSVDNSVVFAKLWNVYRHKSENDLDINIPIVEQRRYGIPDMLGQSAPYRKPSIFRGKMNIELELGNHYLNIDGIRATSNYELQGAHWAMADVEIAVKRRIYGRKLRQSRSNLEKGLTIQHHHVTEEQIRAECEEMKNFCPRVI